MPEAADGKLSSKINKIRHTPSFPRPCQLRSRSMFAPFKLLWRGGGPIGERDGAAATNHCWEHVVKALVVSCGIVQFELRAKPQVKFVDGFDASNQPFTRQILPGALESFHQHHGVDEAFQAYEVRLRGGKEFRQGAA